MQELSRIYTERGNEFIDDLLNRYVVVTEKLSGSSFSFQKKGNKFTFYKGNSGREINLVDRTLMIYYEKPIKYIISNIKNIDIPENWVFCFQYFVHNEPGVISYDNLPKNNLVLTHIKVTSNTGKTAKVISDPRVILDWAKKLNVTPLQPIFVGNLSADQKNKIKEFLSIPIEDQEEMFGTSSFASYLINLLNPNISSSLLHNDLNKPIDSIIFDFYKPGSSDTFTAKLIDPYTKTLMKSKSSEDIRRVPADINEILLLDILAFIEQRGLREGEILSSTPEERYIELISTIFNDYVSKRGNDLSNLNFEKANFIKGDEFDLNLETINNKQTISLLKDNDSLKNLYKIMLGSLRKHRDINNLGNVLTKEVTEDFNKLIDKIKKSTIVSEESKQFKTFKDYLSSKSVNESIYEQDDLSDMIKNERILNFNEFVDTKKINLSDTISEALSIPHKEQGKTPVNIFVGRFQPFTLGHVKVFEKMHKENGLPVVVFLVRGGKPDPEKRPFDEDIQQQMFAKMMKQYPYLEASYIIPSAAIDKIFAILRPTYEPVLWGFGTDRKKAYGYQINNDKYRKELNVRPDFKGYEIFRTDDNISASKVRVAINIDDESTFKKMTPRSIHSFYKTLQNVLEPIMESNSIESIDELTEKKLEIKVGDEVVGMIDDSNTIEFNKTMTIIRTSVSSVTFELFLDDYLRSKNLQNAEADFARKKIIEAYQNTGGSFDVNTLMTTLKNGQLNINDLVGSRSFVDDISLSYGGLPKSFIYDIYETGGKASSAAVGAGEYMLILFTNLLSSPKKDLMDASGVIYEVKDNGKDNAGFRAGSQGKFLKEAITKLNDSSPLYNFNPNIPLNAGSGGKGTTMGEIIEIANTNIKDVNLSKFAKAFLTFENAYDSNIDDVTRSIILKNDVDEFRRYLACLQIWGYMKAGKIANIVAFARAKRIPYALGLIVFDKNFKKFYRNYSKNLYAGGWENDSTNVSARIKYLP